ncbi:hypothetical protein J6590_092231 [Homalodisca vitripennis]|nr:hypothetical protein J6590_092231 [Homalodisca vitripennis]
MGKSRMVVIKNGSVHGTLVCRRSSVILVWALLAPRDSSLNITVRWLRISFDHYNCEVIKPRNRRNSLRRRYPPVARPGIITIIIAGDNAPGRPRFSLKKTAANTEPCGTPYRSTVATPGLQTSWIPTELSVSFKKLGVPMSLDFGSELEIAQDQILSVTVALFISTINLVLYRLSPLFFLIRSSHRPVAHEDGH